MPSQPLKTYEMQSLGESPWPLSRRVLMLLWEYVWALLCQWTPKPLNAWRLFWLKLFGATIHGRPFVHQRARISIPWNLTLHDQACIGDRANIYSLDRIEIGAKAVVAQEAYLCAGTHDFDDERLPLQTAPIIIGEAAFIGARSFILPGIQIGAGAVIGACSVVTRSVDARTINAGNPCRQLRKESTD